MQSICCLRPIGGRPCKHFYPVQQTFQIPEILFSVIFMMFATQLIYDVTIYMCLSISSYITELDRALHNAGKNSCFLFRPQMTKFLNSGTTLIVDRYSYSGVAFTAAKPVMFPFLDSQNFVIVILLSVGGPQICH